MAQAAPGLSATAARASWPKPARRVARIGHQRLFALEEMGAARDVEPEPIGPVDGHQRRITAAPIGRAARARAASPARSAGKTATSRPERPGHRPGTGRAGSPQADAAPSAAMTRSRPPSSSMVMARLSLGKSGYAAQRSVGQFGSHSETIRFIILLQNPGAGPAAAPAQELDMPASVRSRPDPPAQRRGADRGGGPVGAQQKEAHSAAGGGRQLRRRRPAARPIRSTSPTTPAGAGERQALHPPESSSAGLGGGKQDHGRGIEAEPRQPRRIEIALPESGPEHAASSPFRLAHQPAEEKGGEARRRRSAIGRNHLLQASPGQPAAQGLIQGRQPERTGGDRREAGRALRNRGCAEAARSGDLRRGDHGI